MCVHMYVGSCSGFDTPVLPKQVQYSPNREAIIDGLIGDKECVNLYVKFTYIYLHGRTYKYICI